MAIQLVKASTLEQTFFICSVDGKDLSKYMTGYDITKIKLQSEDSGRNEAGTAIINNIAQKTRIDITVTDCPASYIDHIDEALDKDTFNAEYTVGTKKISKDFKAYAGDRKYSRSLFDENNDLWNATFSIIEI